MNIAGLRVRITIQKNETIVDKYGNHTSAWRDFFTCWATAVTSGLSSSEKEEAGHTVVDRDGSGDFQAVPDSCEGPDL